MSVVVSRNVVDLSFGTYLNSVAPFPKYAVQNLLQFDGTPVLLSQYILV